MSVYYKNRYSASQITDDFDVDVTNFNTKSAKEFFIQQIQLYFIVLDRQGLQPTTHRYVRGFGNNESINPAAYSWMDLFTKYQAFYKQAQHKLVGLRLPYINQLMETVTENMSSSNNRVKNWFYNPINYLLSGDGLAHIADKNIGATLSGQRGLVFTSRYPKNNIKFNLGYRGRVDIPNFGEIYYQTDNDVATHLTDYLVALDFGDALSPQYYSIIMCKEYPQNIEELFSKKARFAGKEYGEVLDKEFLYKCAPGWRKYKEEKKKTR